MIRYYEEKGKVIDELRLEIFNSVEVIRNAQNKIDDDSIKTSGDKANLYRTLSDANSKLEKDVKLLKALKE